MKNPAPQPPVLHVGVVGHRRLPDADPALLGATAAGLFRQIRSCAARASGDGLPVVLRCVSNLAEGADAILTEAALAEACALLCPLPFHRERYAQDFADGVVRDRFARLLAAASAVYEIDGIPGSPDGYIEAGRLLLEQSDIVIAVWDGQPERGIGGTGQIVREARRADVPVIVIDAGAPHAARMIGGLTPWDVPASLDVWIGSLIGRCAPPRKTGFASEPAAPRATLAGRFNRALERALLLGSRAAAEVRDGDEPAAGVGPDVTRALARIEQHAGAARTQADALAVQCAEQYRFAATLRFLAIIPAAFATVVGLQTSPAVAALGFATQLAILLGTLLVSWADARAGWHRRYVANRTLAERLRHGRVPALLGSPLAAYRPSDHDGQGEDGSTPAIERELRSLARALGMISARVDAAFVAEVAQILAMEAERQRLFYTARAARFRVLGRRLRAIGATLWIAGIAFTMLRLGMATGFMSGGLYRGVTDLALVLPGLAAVFFGLQSQNEFGRLSRRYDEAARRLARMTACLPLHVASRATLEPIASEIRAIMMTEVSDWRALIQAQGLHPY